MYNYDRNAKFKKGNVLEMVLDLKAATLTYQVNNNKHELSLIQKVKTGTGIEYKLAIFLGDKGDWIQLLSYYEKQERNNKNNEK